MKGVPGDTISNIEETYETGKTKKGVTGTKADIAEGTREMRYWGVQEKILQRIKGGNCEEQIHKLTRF